MSLTIPINLQETAKIFMQQRMQWDLLVITNYKFYINYI